MRTNFKLLAGLVLKGGNQRPVLHRVTLLHMVLLEHEPLFLGLAESRVVLTRLDLGVGHALDGGAGLVAALRDGLREQDCPLVLLPRTGRELAGGEQVVVPHPGHRGARLDVLASRDNAANAGFDGDGVAVLVLASANRITVLDDVSHLHLVLIKGHTVLLHDCSLHGVRTRGERGVRVDRDEVCVLHRHDGVARVQILARLHHAVCLRLQTLLVLVVVLHSRKDFALCDSLPDLLLVLHEMAMGVDISVARTTLDAANSVGGERSQVVPLNDTHRLVVEPCVQIFSHLQLALNGMNRASDGSLVGLFTIGGICDEQHVTNRDLPSNSGAGP
mmetsp:Transcript_15563/g.42401  ORF Transcript_15563/g.42401 Transcript_15563/m.42401 type:complete len:332 (-) Transcript_15563:1107-2102(-)